MRKYIAFGLMFIGLLALIGAVGSVDLGRSTLTESMPLSLLGLCMTFLGGLWYEALDRRSK
jgi:hypothetical protein